MATSNEEHEVTQEQFGKPDRMIPVRSVFGFDSGLMVPAFSERDDHVPEIDPAYRFQPEVTLAILSGFMRDRRVMVQGLHGSGKSTHIEQVAARLNWPCVRVNLDGHISRLDLVARMPSWCATGARSPNSRKASCRGRCNARWR